MRTGNACSNYSAAGDSTKSESRPTWIFSSRKNIPNLNLTGSAADDARAIYCGTIGAEFMHLPEAERRQWIAERMESAAPAVNQQHILERLIRADLFEQVLQARYLGAKRFSLEGVTALIPLLDTLLEVASENGADRVGDGHEPSRTAERDGAHRVQAGSPSRVRF